MRKYKVGDIWKEEALVYRRAVAWPMKSFNYIKEVIWRGERKTRGKWESRGERKRDLERMRD